MPEQAAHRAAIVEYQHVSKSYATAKLPRSAPGAVNDLSLTVPAGKICVLVGPSGCGKTTSLKMVNRLIEPTSGRILIDGADVAGRDATELRREIGYVILGLISAVIGGLMAFIGAAFMFMKGAKAQPSGAE